ncbi:hypothetical protein CDG77_03290 [Nostoc sp. 'Peltigera membranacea cyanobiont' 213]|nr:hypothetical protein CDG77_03290 [Nostoc sp. 'Peltigera membranacea cyanobiont' 213]
MIKKAKFLSFEIGYYSIVFNRGCAAVGQTVKMLAVPASRLLLEEGKFIGIPMKQESHGFLLN